MHGCRGVGVHVCALEHLQNFHRGISDLHPLGGKAEFPVVVGVDSSEIHSKCRFPEAFDKCKGSSHWEITSTIIK